MSTPHARIDKAQTHQVPKLPSRAGWEAWSDEGLEENWLCSQVTGPYRVRGTLHESGWVFEVELKPDRVAGAPITSEITAVMSNEFSTAAEAMDEADLLRSLEVGAKIG